MKVLILSCNTGGGHNAAAKAVAEEVLYRGDEAVVLDYLSLAGGKVSEIVGNVYIEMVKRMPNLFGVVYKLGMVVSKIMRKSPVYFANGKMAKYLQEYLEENPVDVIVMPHLYPAETITKMRRLGMELPVTIAVRTDYTCIPFWEETDCDYYIVPDGDSAKEFVGRGIPEEKIRSFGIPVSRKCNENIEKSRARQQLQMDNASKYILITGGSMGAGTLTKMADLLIEKTNSDEKIIIICGSNKKLYQKLQLRYKNEKNIRIIGYTNKMFLYMKACDVIFTKPGGLTSTEAAVSGIAMVHTKPIPGCETVNRKVFTESGMSVSGKNVKEQADKGLQLLRNEHLRKEMLQKQKAYIESNGAEKIYKLCKKQIV